MNLQSGGIDIFYVDESAKTPLFTASAVAVPFLRPTMFGWKFVWQDYLKGAEIWRRNLSKRHSIRFRKELHAYELIKSQGRYHKKWRNLLPHEAWDVYADALASLNFLPPGSILTTYTTSTSQYAGEVGMGACLLTLFQRMRSQCNARKTNAIVFFDEGHTEYIRAFRKAQKYLPTGSAYGGWGGKASKNLPLDMFPKDANFKHSDLSYFVQMADLVAYAGRLKIERERGTLANKRVVRKHHQLYDQIAAGVVNLKATKYRQDGIATV